MLQDEQLMEECCNGSLAAFELLMQRWDQRMLAYFYRCTYSIEDAKDLRQELFLRIYQNRKRFHSTGNFSAWAYTIASNLVIDKVARKKTVPTQHMDETNQMETDSHFQHESTARSNLQTGKLHEFLNAALQQLPSEQRMALVLRHMEELSFIQIAKIMNLPESTVKTRVYRGLVALKKELKRNGIAEADCLQMI